MAQDATYSHDKFKSAAFAFIASFLLYGRSVGFGFVMDDVFQILGNPAITDLSNLPRFFTTPVWAMLGEKPTGNIFFRPMMYVFYSLDHAAFGLKPWGFHLASTLIHSLNAVLVFLVAGRVTRKLSATNSENLNTPIIASFVFSAHAINSEAVSWLGALPELLFTFFLLAAVYLHITAESPVRRILAASALLFSLLSKETAIVLLPLVFAYDLITGARRRAVLRQLPLVVATAIYILLRQNALSGWEKARLLDATHYEFITNAFVIFRHYVLKLLVPTGMNALYDIDPLKTMLSGKAIISIVITAAFFYALVYARKNKAIFFSLIWVLLPLIPVLFTQRLSTHGYADRYLYLSTIGFGLLIASIASSLIKSDAGRKKTVYIAIGVFILLHACAGFTRSAVWKDGLTLWSDIVEKSPTQPNARYNLAWYLEEVGDIDGAIREYKISVRLAPGLSVDALYNMANLYEKSGRPAEAIDAYRALLLLVNDPQRRGKVFIKIGDILQNTNDPKGARKAYEEALRMLPEDENLRVRIEALS